MRIALFGKNFSKDFNPYLKLLFNSLKSHSCSVAVYKPFYDFVEKNTDFLPEIDGFFSDHADLNKNTDLLISIGGDGSYLETVNIIRNSGIPVVGINCGRLGFLANISKNEIELAINDIIGGNFSLEKRTLVHLESSLNVFGDFPYGLNEFTIHKKDSSSMITIHAYVNDEYLTTYWADGLIVATPTGSTAYALSVGGPLITPDSASLVLLPIAPHNLSVRPLVLPDSSVIRLSVDCRDLNYLITLDSRSEILDKKVDLIITRGLVTVNTLLLKNQNFFKTLTSKLMWGSDLRN